MLTNAVAFYGCLALSFIVVVSTDTDTLPTVENCREKVDECKKIAKTVEEIVNNQMKLAKCFMSFKCRDNEDDVRMKAMFEFGSQLAVRDEVLLLSHKDTSGVAGTFSVPYRMALITSAVTAFLFA